MNQFNKNPEKDISAEFSFQMKKIHINDIDMSYYEQGEGEVVLFLHGIPTSSYIWRNIVGKVGKHQRAIALDLMGYGQSGISDTRDGSLVSQVAYLKGFIEALDLKDITLVVNDLGSLVGLKYAVENMKNIKRIAFLEAVFMSAELWYKQIAGFLKLMFFMMRWTWMAGFSVITLNMVPYVMMHIASIRKIDQKALEQYYTPYKNDKKRRGVMFYGIGPAQFSPYGKTQFPGDFADEVNRNASGLLELSKKIPYLLFTSSPGMICRSGAIEYAQNNFKYLSVVHLGKGKHFLQEDHPGSIADTIIDWIKNN